MFKSFEMTLNSKHGTEKLKTKNQRNRNMKNQNAERRKPSFTKRTDRKCRLTEQNADHMRIMHKIQFLSSFKF